MPIQLQFSDEYRKMMEARAHHRPVEEVLADIQKELQCGYYGLPFSYYYHYSKKIKCKPPVKHVLEF